MEERRERIRKWEETEGRGGGKGGRWLLGMTVRSREWAGEWERSLNKVLLGERRKRRRKGGRRVMLL